ncbi:MAG TPA: ORF6N domain-containing protein [Bacteroides sp.]|nr:ORF6N domain-containing protein [Bacteroides sp.]
MPDEIITSKIYLIRNKKVMLDEDLADLYGVETRRLNEQVKRNIARFPLDFMFQITINEYESLISQFATSNRGGRRKLPYAFTEQGVAMLSGVLHGEIAVKVNIQIMRVFTRMREMLESHKEILTKLEHLERKDIEQDEKILLIFEYLKQLEQARKQELDQKNRNPIGYKRNMG